MSDDDGYEVESQALNLPDGALLRGVVEIVRFLEADGSDGVYMQYVDGGGSDLPLIEVLGMLRLAEDTAIRTRMAELSE